MRFRFRSLQLGFSLGADRVHVNWTWKSLWFWCDYFPSSDLCLLDRKKGHLFQIYFFPWTFVLTTQLDFYPPADFCSLAEFFFPCRLLIPMDFCSLDVFFKGGLFFPGILVHTGLLISSRLLFSSQKLFTADFFPQHTFLFVTWTLFPRILFSNNYSRMDFDVWLTE